SATPTGGSAARWRRSSSGRMRATSSPSRTTSPRSSRSSRAGLSTRRRRRPRRPRPRRRARAADRRRPCRKNLDPMATQPALAERAPAKVNLSLHVLGRRADGYHELESLVVFAAVGDRLALAPGAALSLEVTGPFAAKAGASADNLVLTAATRLNAA